MESRFQCKLKLFLEFIACFAVSATHGDTLQLLADAENTKVMQSGQKLFE